MAGLALAGCGGAGTGAVSPAGTSASAAASSATAPATTTAAVSTTAASTKASSATTTASATAAAQATTKLSYWFWGDPSYLPPEQRVAKAFQQQYPAVAVDLTILPYGDLLNKLTTSFAAGDPPDTFHLDMPLVQSYFKRDVLTDLGQLLGRDPQVNLAFYQASTYSKTALDIMSAHGHVLGLPSSAAPNLFYYNADLFRAAGLQTPHQLWKAGGWTWDACLHALTRITKKIGSTWQTAGISYGLPRLWMNAAGGKEFDDIKAPKQCLYDLPGSIEALSFIHDLIYKDNVAPASFSKEIGSDDTKAFAAGKVAMMARWTSGILVYKDITSFKWGMVPYPKQQVAAHDFATSGDAIAKGSKAQDAAWQWVRYPVSPEGSLTSAVDGTNVFFQAAPQKVALQALQKIASLETPDAVTDVMADGPGTFIRLLSVDQDKINSLISKGLNTIWNNTAAPADAAKSITQSVGAFLQANPQ